MITEPENINRERLEVLGRHLANLTPKYNKLHFDMDLFFSHNGQIETPEQAIETLSAHICGTSACAVGHLPLLFPKEAKKVTKKHAYINEYGDASGIGDAWRSMTEEILGIPFHTRLWTFLFGSEWAYKSFECDDYVGTSWAVADRIAYILNGEYEKNADVLYHSQMMNKAKGMCAKMGWVTKQKLNSNIKKFEKMLEA